VGGSNRAVETSAQPKDVSKILWEVWDPLELRRWASVSTEYDDYVQELVDALNSGASEPELASTLNRIFVQTIGAGVLPAPIRKSATAAHALVELRRKMKS
jgi:hypothetical protein